MDDFVAAWVNSKIILARNDWRNGKLHIDVGMGRADVLVAIESIQFESNVDVSTSTSI